MFARKHFYVYTLAYPDGTVFYVGKGSVKSRKSLWDRIEDHEVEARQGVQSPKCDIIREIWAQGLEVQKSVVYETDAEEEALRYEYALITLMSGNGNLTNYGTTRLTERGALPAFRADNLWRFRRIDVEEYINRQLRSGQEPKNED